ncbi:MAG: galactokinase [Spirochaetaceae bacterium]|nr:galactokinase [Spirochaetaceae bacterium]
MKIHDFSQGIQNGEFDSVLKKLYGSSDSTLCYQRNRYIDALDSFSVLYPKHEDIRIFSAPGRTEIGGNHTDHQNGCVLAAAVNFDVIGVVAFHDEDVIRIKSQGYDAFQFDINDLSVRHGKKDSEDIVRGIVAKFIELGVQIQGFDLYTTSDVLAGSGISSSAAFETLVGTIIDLCCNNGKAGAVEIAKIGQFAENVYFGKKSGLMDQMVSSVGGLVSIDFMDTNNPLIDSFQFDFEGAGYCLCITDTKGSHEHLTPDYVAIRSEMESVAAFFEKTCLRFVDEVAFYDKLPELRKNCTDRAILRAAHFFSENRRACQETIALKNGDIESFLQLVRESGNSSANYLQNLYSVTQPATQEIPVAIMLSKRILCETGAVRVHGGGFAGTIQAFVPLDKVECYEKEMNRIFSDGSCHRMRIRPVGGLEITK